MNFKIRVATKNDAKAIHDIYGEYTPFTNVTFTIDNPSIEQYEIDIDHTLNKYPYLVAVDENDTVLGYVCGHEFRPHDAYLWCVESSLYLSHKTPKRSGIATALYNKLFEYLNMQGYKFVYGVLVDKNIPSIKLHEKLDFEKVGELKNCGFKNNEWLGIVYYVKQIGDLKDTKKPIGFKQLMKIKE